METPRILVIDDEIGICQGIQRALKPTGYQVDISTSSDKGLEIIQKDSYNLVLLDVMMPGVSGIDLIASIHKHDPEIVCIIITGYATVELAVQAIKQGAYDFLTKPFSVDNLLLVVNQGLERQRLSIEAKRAAYAEAEARRLAEEKTRLEELDRAKQQFFRLVTHELQAPIAAIQNYLNLIRDGYVPPEKQDEVIQKCLLRAEEETDLITDLLELGKIQAIEAQAREATASLDKTLQEVVKGFSDQIDQKHIKLIITISGPIPLVTGLPNQLKSLWKNLISNALKYTPENGTISISLCADGEYVIGEVMDTGIGIPQDEQDKLFTEFYRATNAKEQDFQGTGLGLVIVKRVVEIAGGEISISSEVGHGATFTLKIPAVNQAGTH